MHEFYNKYFIDKLQGHWQNCGAGGRCWPSGGRRPCTPCGWSPSWQGSHSSSSSCRLRIPSSPCVTWGGGTSLVHCSVAISVRQARCWSPWNPWQEPCSPSSLEWPWYNRCGCHHPLRCWACCQS